MDWEKGELVNKNKNNEIYGIPDNLEDWRIVDQDQVKEPDSSQEYIWVNCIDERTGQVTKAPIRVQIFEGEI